MLKFDLTFILVQISAIISLVLLFIIRKYKKNTQIKLVFLVLTLLMIVWNFSTLALVYTRQLFGYTNMIFVNINYFSICFVPVVLFLLGVTYAKTKIEYTWKYLLLFVVPVITTIVIWTNPHHQLFFENYSTYSSEAVYGPYYYFHSVYSYALIFIGVYYLFSSSFKNSGFFSKQSRLLLLGISAPLLLNILYSFNLLDLTFEINSVAFTVAEVCFVIAIFKFNFLNIAPIALHQVIDRISDSFLVINEESIIIDFNFPMTVLFSEHLSIKRNEDLFGLITQSSVFSAENLEKLNEAIAGAHEHRQTMSYDDHFVKDSLEKYFNIEVTPIIQKEEYLATIILFKDITENVNYIATIEEKHALMMEQERLASLGQLMGGIAHNLKTPIMSIAGAVEALKELVNEYDESIGDKDVTHDDHHEIAFEMHTWLHKIRPYCSYMTDIIDTVKGQAVQLNASTMISFTINELIKRIELLLKYELVRSKCTLNTVNEVDYNTEIRGDVNSLVQVFDNIIINAIQAYEGQVGTIDFMITGITEGTLFQIRDYAKGIPDSIKHRLLKEMVTTKGKDGTGLGLYMSYSTIIGRFGGKMWFESEEGKGTSFFVHIPKKQ